MDMRIVLALLVALTGCVRVLPSDEVARQMKLCRDKGGEPVATTVSNYNAQVKFVTCYAKGGN